MTKEAAIRVNGKIDVAGAQNVAELLSRHGIDQGARFLAIAVNGAVVRRALWPTTSLAPGDQVEIVRPLQGG